MTCGPEFDKQRVGPLLEVPYQVSIVFQPFAKQAIVFPCPPRKSFEKEQFLLFP